MQPYQQSLTQSIIIVKTLLTINCKYYQDE